ncbi:gp71 [Mycobacterium phage Barnyard]|uniref:Uncharacterized protein n=1 Tax=Mycobacterium phage Barnyard TaxID=205880 RepID=Q856A1_9CAUD|nr:gp71 [Mycobacterium phage Barnyard]AAN02125.1 hypothetical protein PBI_BARNYARD_71 [Mycobacterium phage Barnyard]
MSKQETLLITVNCDVKGCANSIACGSNWSYPEEQGWHLDVPVDTRHMDLCPECYGDLKAFTDGDPDDEQDIMNLRDVLAGEQPRPEDAKND